VSDSNKKKSKFLSLVLRHEPSAAGVTLDEAGWASVEELLAGCRRAGVAITDDELREIVRTSDKQRFALSDDGTRIRANQGHSVDVELGYEPAEPPAVLWHGTAEVYLVPIREQGLLRGARHHVHLSETVETASAVGRRHGRLVLLQVDAGRMHRDGFTFFRTPNRVWLADHVPVHYLTFPAGPDDR
jgi:putative RNA 2'-phosphotransferase